MRIILTLLGTLLLLSCTTAPTPPVIPVTPSPTPTPESKAQQQEAAKYRQLGLKYRAQGDFTQSLAALEKSVQLAPSHVEGKVILGWTQHLAEQRQAAIATLTNALAQKPEQVSTLNALGIVYLVEGDLVKAVSTHKKALELKPDNEIAHFNLALAYHRLEDGAEAIAHAQKATELEPYNPHTWVALALVQWSGGDKKSARFSYTRAVALDGRYQQPSFLAHLQEAAFTPEQIQVVREIL
jgi:Flp pilus assembly protein TadD